MATTNSPMRNPTSVNKDARLDQSRWQTIWTYLAATHDTRNETVKARLRRYSLPILIMVMLFFVSLSQGAAYFVMNLPWAIVGIFSVYMLLVPFINFNEAIPIEAKASGRLIILVTTFLSVNISYNTLYGTLSGDTQGTVSLPLALVVISLSAMAWLFITRGRLTQAGDVTVLMLLILSCTPLIIAYGSFGTVVNQPIPVDNRVGAGVLYFGGYLLVLLMPYFIYRNWQRILLAGLITVGIHSVGIRTATTMGDVSQLIVSNYVLINSVLFAAIFAFVNQELRRREQEFLVLIDTLEHRVEARTQELAEALKITEVARDEADRANNVKSAFLASMSHELRTPLNAIINFSKYLKKGGAGDVNEKQEHLMGLVSESGEHLLTLINDVLDMSKIEAGSLKLYVENAVDLRDTIELAISFTQSLGNDKPIELKTEIPEVFPVITADRKRLLQVLLNILSNAFKFTEEGEIVVRATSDDKKVLISITDTGHGIAPEDHDSVFEAFKQTESGLQQGGHGSGLGIPISKKLVEAHEGRLWLESELGKGTTFHVELPLESSLVPTRS